MNTVSEEGIAKINATSKLVLRRRGDSAVEFYNAANNLRRAILSRLCKNINHKYMNGINCIYLNYSRTESLHSGKKQ